MSPEPSNFFKGAPSCIGVIALPFLPAPFSQSGPRREGSASPQKARPSLLTGCSGEPFCCRRNGGFWNGSGRTRFSHSNKVRTKVRFEDSASGGMRRFSVAESRPQSDPEVCHVQATGEGLRGSDYSVLPRDLPGDCGSWTGCSSPFENQHSHSVCGLRFIPYLHCPDKLQSAPKCLCLTPIALQFKGSP